MHTLSGVHYSTPLEVSDKSWDGMKEKYKIAGHVFEINSRYDNVHKLCEEYKTEEPAEFNIETTQEDIREMEISTRKECEKENTPFVPMAEGIYEESAVYAKLVAQIFPYDVILFHGSTLAVDNCAYMFIAKSGTGKSTHSRMWRELLGSRVTMVNDDKPLVQISDEGAIAYGTPWNGKHHLGENVAVPLKGICILRRGETNAIRPIRLSEAYPMLLQQVYRVPGRENIKKEMELLDKLAAYVKFYDMSCNISAEAAGMAYKVMHKGEK